MSEKDNHQKKKHNPNPVAWNLLSFTISSFVKTNYLEQKALGRLSGYLRKCSESRWCLNDRRLNSWFSNLGYTFFRFQGTKKWVGIVISALTAELQSTVISSLSFSGLFLNTHSYPCAYETVLCPLMHPTNRYWQATCVSTVLGTLVTLKFISEFREVHFQYIFTLKHFIGI